MWNQEPSFRFEIDNFSEKEGAIESKTFVSGGCEWYLAVYPKGHNNRCDDHLLLSLCVPDSNSLRTGWKRSVMFFFVVLNQSDKELYKSFVGKVDTFCAESPRWGFHETLPLSKLQEKGYLENDRLIIEVYINVTEAVDGEEDEDVSSEKETVEINAFRAFASQVTSVRKIFTERVQKTEYKNVLSNACSKLSELAEVGSKIDWLKSKIDEVSLKRKKADGADVSQIQQLEERVKNLELKESDANVYPIQQLEERVKNLELKESLERKESDANVSEIQQLEERVKNLELNETDLKLESRDKMDCLNSQLADISLKRQKSYNANLFRFQKLEERVMNLELILHSKLDCLKSKFEEDSLERKKSEEQIKNLELILHSKLDCLKSKLEEDSLEKKNSEDTHESQVQHHEKRIANLDMELHFKLDCLESKLEEDSLERRESDEAHESQVHQHEERIKNLELMISDLKVELKKEKEKSFDDEYLLVD